jgi:2-dehydropantoate 2-reductase
VAVIGSMIAEPGVIEQAGTIAHFTLGELDGSRSVRAQGLVSAFAAAGVEARLSEHIEMDIWEKFIALAAWSGVSALTRGSFGVVRAHDETRRLLIDSVHEVVAVALGKGIALRPGALDRSLNLLLENAPAIVKASMLRDLEQGKRLEVPWLSGLVVRLGRELGIPTPTHSTIVAALAPYVDGVPREPH